MDVGVGGPGEPVHGLQNLDGLLRRRAGIEEVDALPEDREVVFEVREVGQDF